jgi:hypothetical protein
VARRSHRSRLAHDDHHDVDLELDDDDNVARLDDIGVDIDVDDQRRMRR